MSNKQSACQSIFRSSRRSAGGPDRAVVQPAIFLWRPVCTMQGAQVRRRRGRRPRSLDARARV